jgi:hypothetical protein
MADLELSHLDVLWRRLRSVGVALFEEMCRQYSTSSHENRGWLDTALQSLLAFYDYRWELVDIYVTAHKEAGTEPFLTADKKAEVEIPF